MASRLLFCRRKASGCGVHVLCSAQLAMNSEFRMRTGNRNSQLSILASMYCNNTNSSHFLIIRIYFHCQLYFHFQFSHFLPFLQGYPEWSGFTLRSLDASVIFHFAAVAYGQPRKHQTAIKTNREGGSSLYGLGRTRLRCNMQLQCCFALICSLLSSRFCA
jgi:hypothetical protein